MFDEGIYKIFSESNPGTTLGSLEITDSGHKMLAELAEGQTWPITLPDEQRIVFECVESAPDGEFPVKGSASTQWVDWEPGAASEETAPGGEMVEKHDGQKWKVHGYGFVDEGEPQMRNYGFETVGYPLQAVPGVKYALSRDSEIGSLSALQTRLDATWGDTWSGYEITESYQYE